jgi:hypothetical protein
MSFLLETTFKGSRHYIHGSDLFNAVQSAAQGMPGGEGVYISRLGFNHFAYHQCELYLDECVGSNSTVAEGELKFTDGSHKRFCLREGTRKPTERNPYDEDSMVAVAAYSEQSATLQAPISYTTIEVVIALTKVLNYRLATPKQGKWVFGKIELNQSLPEIRKFITVTRTKAIPGRFSVNEIVIDGGIVGAIQFIVGTP